MNAGNDPFDLQRFVTAQADCYDQVLAELRAGRKRSHWMWFVFPQLAGLGRSPTAAYYAIRNIDEAKAYLAHDVLGPRLQECTGLLLVHDGLSAADVFGYPDDLKFRSSMTLFEYVASDATLFSEAISKYCAGIRDEKTLSLIGSGV
jgi:uncharacterized protein (DUF1810 family)